MELLFFWNITYIFIIWRESQEASEIVKRLKKIKHGVAVLFLTIWRERIEIDLKIRKIKNGSSIFLRLQVAFTLQNYGAHGAPNRP